VGRGSPAPFLASIHSGGGLGDAFTVGVLFVRCAPLSLFVFPFLSVQQLSLGVVFEYCVFLRLHSYFIVRLPA
jgi:hypothetical protein